ncbi:MAG: DUF4330 family protein [Clostridia bacterium]|nr:DUF4330 family protein [Clostridia bacterium]
MNKNVNTNKAVPKNKKKKKASGPRFNVFDFLIIFAILICAGAIIVRAIFIGTAKKDMTTATVVFEVSYISDVTANALDKEEPQPIYLQSDDTRIGTIIKAEQTPQKILEKDENGILQSVIHPEKYTVKTTANIEGVWSDDGFLINGTQLATVGKTFDIYTPYVSCTFTVVSISPKQ